MTYDLIVHPVLVLISSVNNIIYIYIESEPLQVYREISLCIYIYIYTTVVILQFNSESDNIIIIIHIAL